MSKNRKPFNAAFSADVDGSAKGKGAVDNVPYALLKQARGSGVLNLSNRSLAEVPERVWKINVDVPDEAKNVALANDGERWWDQVDLRKLILASNQISAIPDDIKHIPALTVLDIHDNLLETISEELGYLKELSKLNLSHNKISIFPKSFCDLESITVLQLNGNKIVDLPFDIGRLYRVEELDLAENNLVTLPDSLGNLKKLKRLKLAKNGIKLLPPSFENLTSLVDLDLSNNKLEALPAGFGGLTSLEILDCRYNFIKTFSAFKEPANIRQLFLGYNRVQVIDSNVFEKLPYLVTLDIRDNAIGSIPNTLVQLKCLERVDLSNNSIATVPFEIGRMDLKSLSLDGNPVRSIRRDVLARGTQAILQFLRSRLPDELKTGDAQALNVAAVQSTAVTAVQSTDDDVLRVNGSKSKAVESSQKVLEDYVVATTKALVYSSKSVATIPDSVWLAGAQITSINFSNNLLAEFPRKVVDYCNTLAELDMSSNKIVCVPPEVGSLKKLTFVDFSHNLLASLPVEFKDLPFLLQVNLSYNRFSDMPPILFDLPVLQTVLLANNNLQVIDVEGLMKLKTLHTLDVSNNNIGHVPPALGKVDWLKSLQLEGNSFRNPRPAVLQKGTQFLLSYLRDRIPT